jgi:hypothetical protein
LAEGWRAACVACAELGFVHGDLNGDNVVVRQAQAITLVDYDTALWPGAQSIPSPSSNPAYRHPRGATTDAVRRDEFAAFVIYASLRILSRWPELRDDHGDPPQERGGSLLFRSRDLASPDGSALFGKIRVLDDPFIQSLGGILRETCRGKPDETPSFVDALAMANNVARRVSTAPSAPPPGEPERRTRVSTLTESGTWGRRAEDRQAPSWPTQRVQEPPSPPVSRRPPTEDLGAAVRQTSAAQLRAALEAGDLATAERLWPGLLDTAEGGPYAVALAEARSTAARSAVRDALIKRDDELLVREVERATDLGVPLSIESRREARAAGLRLDIEFELERALETGDDAALVDLALSGDLDELPSWTTNRPSRGPGAVHRPPPAGARHRRRRRHPPGLHRRHPRRRRRPDRGAAPPGRSRPPPRRLAGPTSAPPSGPGTRAPSRCSTSTRPRGPSPP